VALACAPDNDMQGYKGGGRSAGSEGDTLRGPPARRAHGLPTQDAPGRLLRAEAEEHPCTLARQGLHTLHLVQRHQEILPNPLNRTTLNTSGTPRSPHFLLPQSPPRRPDLGLQGTQAQGGRGEGRAPAASRTQPARPRFASNGPRVSTEGAPVTVTARELTTASSRATVTNLTGGLTAPPPTPAHRQGDGRTAHRRNWTGPVARSLREQATPVTQGVSAGG